MLSFIKTLCSDDFPSKENMFDFTFKMDYPRPPTTAFCDWLRVTNTNVDNFYQFVKYFNVVLKKLGFTIHDTGRGMSGYTNCWAINFNNERVGSFAADGANSMGGLFELTGKGCQMLQADWVLWCSVMYSLSLSDFSIVRLDVSSDFRGYAWNEYNVNIVDVLKEVKKGTFKVGRGSRIEPKIDTLGDWSGFVCQGLTAETYNPAEFCPDGLTVNVGKRESVNSWCIYEKGKQLLGAGFFKHLSERDAKWIRIERRFARGSGRSKVVIPFDFAVHLDQAFIYNCDGLKAWLKKYDDFQGGCGIRDRPADHMYTGTKKIDLERIGTFQGKYLVKKAFWAMRHAGRTIKSLLSVGMSADMIISLLASDKVAKGFIDDLTNCPDILGEFEKLKHA